MRSMPDLHGKGTSITYPQLLHSSVISTDQVAEELQVRSSFTVGDIKGLICSLATYIAERTAEGSSVKIDGLGTFFATLRLVAGVEREVDGGTKRNARSVCIRTIRFRANRKMVTEAQKCCVLERVRLPERKKKVIKPEERLRLASSYMAERGFLRVKDYAHLTGLATTQASVELRKWKEEGYMITSGRATHKVYMLPQDKA